MNLGLYFSDVFEVDAATLEDYGAFNISLVNDVPLFVDPFLLFYSDDEGHQEQHRGIIKYLRFLRDRASEDAGTPSRGTLQAWYQFPEVRQNWLGYSKVGNRGAGLGIAFARTLHRNLSAVFPTFGKDPISRSSHLEKLCLLEEGIGRDSVSDFVTNLIKGYLLRYTEAFARKHLPARLCGVTPVGHVRFNYVSRTWEPDRFLLPRYMGDFVMLTPIELLTRDVTWINSADLHRQFDDVIGAVPNEQLRAELNQFWAAQLPTKPHRDDYARARAATLREYPEVIDYFIRMKEDAGDEARRASTSQVDQVHQIFVNQVSQLVEELRTCTTFYNAPATTLDETRARALFLKDVIENKGGHRFFYANGTPIRREHDLHLLFRLTWFATPSDVTREANDGRGPADFKVSRGSRDKTLAEFKLASNTSLKRNLEKQVEIYQKASDAPHAIKVIVYFNDSEYAKVRTILQALGIQGSPDIILIDAGNENKPAGSKA